MLPTNFHPTIIANQCHLLQAIVARHQLKQVDFDDQALTAALGR